MNKRIEEGDDPFGPFNLSHFKKWMDHQQDAKSKSSLVGFQVESKIPYKKLVSRIETQLGDIEEVARDFKKNGGLVNEVDGPNILIEVTSGTFLIHKMYIKKHEDD